MTDHAHRKPDPTADNPGEADQNRARRIPAHPVTPRHAASLIVWRDGLRGPEVLMGHRHASHKFMPNVMVFAGGRVDREDHRAAATSELAPETRAMLERKAPPSLARALGIAAARELFEETGLVLGERRGDGIAADLAPLHYICRAITPPRQTRRFNARFLAVPAAHVHGDIAGSGELEDLQFYPVQVLGDYPVAGITRLVLAEFVAWLAMTPEARASRRLVLFSGKDDRRLER